MPALRSANESDISHSQGLESIRSLNQKSSDLGERAITWLTYCARPLRLQELQAAVAINADGILVEQDIRPVQDIIETCTGLVVIEQEDSIIRLLPEISRECIHQPLELCTTESNLKIARSCIALLSSDWSGELVEYASKFWPHHLRRAPNAQQLSWALEFLSSDLIMPTLSKEDFYYVTEQATGLHLAAYFGLDVALKAFIQRGLDPNVASGRGWTAIFYATKGGYCSTINALVMQGAKIDVRCHDPLSRWAIQEAVFRSQYDAVELLLNIEAELDGAEREAWEYRDAKNIALHTAVARGDIKMVSLLLGKGACIDYMHNGSTVLMLAVSGEDDGMTRFLIDHGANVNARGRGGETVLMSTMSLSSDWANAKQAAILLGYHVDTDLRDSCGRTVLDRAAMIGNAEMVRLLINHGARVDGDSAGWTPLYLAVHDGHIVVVQLLLEAGADPDKKTDKQQISAVRLANHLVQSHSLDRQRTDILGLLQAYRKQHSCLMM